MGPSQGIRRSPTSSRWWAGGALGVVLLVSAACGSSSATPHSSTGGQANPTASTGAASGPSVVKMATVGTLGPVLVDSAGMTLYRYTPDGKDKSVCTGTCASLWPPLTVPAGTTATGAAGIPGADLGVFARTDGTHQIAYKGMPLYTYTGDTKAGEASGQGVGGTWFVVTASSSAPATGGSSPSTTAAPSGGNGY